MQTIQQITLELNENINYRYVYGIQFDNASRFIMITLTENGIKFVPPQKPQQASDVLNPMEQAVLMRQKLTVTER